MLEKKRTNMKMIEIEMNWNEMVSKCFDRISLDDFL